MAKWRPLQSIRKRVARLRGFPQLVRCDGASLLLDPGNWIDNRLLAGAAYETEQLARVRALIDSLGATEFIDIGANFGLYSIMVAHDRRVERVLSFEPVRRNFNQLCANIFSNRFDAIITPYRRALGKARTDAVIHIDPHSTGISRLDLGGAERDAQVFRERETIQIHKGDDCLTFEDRVVVAKIDVEGAALDVAQGLERFLAKNFGALQVEISEREKEVASFLETKGWRHAGVIGPDHYFARPRETA